jgi:hypothetical protein
MSAAVSAAGMDAGEDEPRPLLLTGADKLLVDASDGPRDGSTVPQAANHPFHMRWQRRHLLWRTDEHPHGCPVIHRGAHDLAPDRARRTRDEARLRWYQERR